MYLRNHRLLVSVLDSVSSLEQVGQLMPRRRFYSITHRPHVSPVALVAGIRVLHLPPRDLTTTGWLKFSGEVRRECISI
jgi:hypothetical protein